MEILDEIVTAPVFIQISTFGLKLAIDLFHLETVSIDFLFRLALLISQLLHFFLFV